MVNYESNIGNIYGCQLLVADLPDTIPLNHVRLGCPTVGAQVQPRPSIANSRTFLGVARRGARRNRKVLCKRVRKRVTKKGL